MGILTIYTWYLVFSNGPLKDEVVRCSPAVPSTCPPPLHHWHPRPPDHLARPAPGEAEGVLEASVHHARHGLPYHGCWDTRHRVEQILAPKEPLHDMARVCVYSLIRLLKGIDASVDSRRRFSRVDVSSSRLRWRNRLVWWPTLRSKSESLVQISQVCRLHLQQRRLKPALNSVPSRLSGYLLLMLFLLVVHIGGTWCKFLASQCQRPDEDCCLYPCSCCNSHRRLLSSKVCNTSQSSSDPLDAMS